MGIDKTVASIQAAGQRHGVKINPIELNASMAAFPELHAVATAIDSPPPTDPGKAKAMAADMSVQTTGDAALRKALTVMVGICDRVMQFHGAMGSKANQFVTDTAAAIHTILDKYPG